jgi:hypothetical protein
MFGNAYGKPPPAHEFIRQRAKSAREVRKLHAEMDREEAEKIEREHVEARFDRVRRRLASKHAAAAKAGAS